MIASNIKDKLIEDLFTFSQKQLLTPSNLGILKSGSNEKFLEFLDQINTTPLTKEFTQKEYDSWFDSIVTPFHSRMMRLYRDNLVISEDNPYSYSARILNQYIRVLCLQSWLYGYRGEYFIKTQHPIMSNSFLKKMSHFEIKRVNQIKSKEDYYRIINLYRMVFDDSSNARNNILLDLRIGVDF